MYAVLGMHVSIKYRQRHEMQTGGQDNQVCVVMDRVAVKIYRHANNNTNNNNEANI